MLKEDLLITIKNNLKLLGTLVENQHFNLADMLLKDTNEMINVIKGIK